MGETNPIPLIQAACYLTYEKDIYDSWLDLLKSRIEKLEGNAANSLSERPAVAWLLYVNKNAPAQEFVEDTSGEWQRKQPCKQMEYKDRQREKIRKELIKIIKYAATHDGEILKGKAPKKSGYSTIPSDFLLLVNDGLSIIGDINLNHSDLLVFDGKSFKAKCTDKKCPFMHEYYRDVLVDWIIIKDNILTDKYLSKSEPQEICIQIIKELIAERGELKSGLTQNWLHNTDLYKAVWERWRKQYENRDGPALSSLKNYYKEYKKRTGNLS